MPLIFRTIRQSNQKAHPNADTCRRTSSSVKQGEPWLLIPPVYQSIESNRLLSTPHLSFHCRSSLTSQEMWTQTQRNKTHKYEVRLLMLHYSEPLPYAVESTDSQWKHPFLSIFFGSGTVSDLPFLLFGSLLLFVHCRGISTIPMWSHVHVPHLGCCVALLHQYALPTYEVCSLALSDWNTDLALSLTD